MSDVRLTDGDRVWWHNPGETGRRDARPGFYHDDPDGIYIIPTDGDDPGERVNISPIYVHHGRYAKGCAWCPTEATEGG